MSKKVHSLVNNYKIMTIDIVPGQRRPFYFEVGMTLSIDDEDDMKISNEEEFSFTEYVYGQISESLKSEDPEAKKIIVRYKKEDTDKLAVEAEAKLEVEELKASVKAEIVDEDKLVDSLDEQIKEPVKVVKKTTTSAKK